MNLRTGLMAAAAAFALAACGGGIEMTEMADATAPTGSLAGAACVTAVNANMTGSTSTVVSSDFSEAGTLVMLRSSDGTDWRCLASNDGVVQDLSVV